MVAQRAELGKNFGVVLIPEGLVEFMHDVSELITGARECVLLPAQQVLLRQRLGSSCAEVLHGALAPQAQHTVVGPAARHGLRRRGARPLLLASTPCPRLPRPHPSPPHPPGPQS